MNTFRFRTLAWAAVPLTVLSTATAQPVGGDGFAATSAVAANVTVPKHWYALRTLVTSRMRDTVPEYENLPGLAFKAYSFSLASARAQFNPAWFKPVQRERRVAGQVRFLEVTVAHGSSCPPPWRPAQRIAG